MTGAGAATAPDDAPEPPPRFRGAFLSGMQARAAAADVSGPVSFVPRAVAVPTDTEDVATLVRWAATQGVPLVPRGAGTGMPGGNVGPGVLVDLSTFSGPPRPRPDDGLVEAGAAVTGAALDACAGAMGRFLPPLPSSAARCSLGGMLANDAAGARTFGFGPVHAWVDAAEVVLADGTVAHLEAGGDHPLFQPLRERLAEAHPAPLPWPSVRKNASGYALDRFLPGGDPLQLLVGSEGTLGIVTRIRFRTHPLPSSRWLVLLPVPDVEELVPAVRGISGPGATVCEFFGTRFLDLSGVRDDPSVGPLVGRHPALLLVEVAGDAELVETAAARVVETARALGVRARVGRSDAERDALWAVRHAASPVVAARAAEGLVSMQFIEDSVVPQEHLPRYLRGLATILEEEETDAVVFGHAGDGNVHVNPLVDVRRAEWRERVRRILEGTVSLVSALGGTLSGEHGDGRIRAPFHDRVFGPEVASLFRAVKDHLDPRGILNPGVVVASPGQDPLDGLTPRRRTR